MSPLYYRRKTATGYEMIEQPVPEGPPQVDLVMPSVDAAEPVVAKRLFCTLCKNKPFPSPGVASMHFAKVHGDLKTERDSWRRYVVANVANA